MIEPFFAGGPAAFPQWQTPALGFGLQQPFPGNPPAAGLPGPFGIPGSIAAPNLAPPGSSPFNYPAAGFPSGPAIGAQLSGPSIGYGSPAAFGQPTAGLPGFAALSGYDLSVGMPAVAVVAAVAARRGQPMGPNTDQDIEAVIYDALDLLAGTEEVEARCEGGRVVLTGSVPHRRIKRDVGEIAWAIPATADVQNNVTIAARRRGRQREQEQQPGAATGSSRKQQP